MYIGVTFVFNPVILTLFTQTETVKYSIGLTILIIVLTLAAIFLWMTVHSFIQPMRLFNARMKDVMDAKPLGDLPEKPDGESQEINNLYELFKNLI